MDRHDTTDRQLSPLRTWVIACTLTVTASLTQPAVALAQPYVAVFGGPSIQTVGCDNLPTCDRTGKAFRVSGGYRITQWVAAELSYVRFGRARLADPFFTQDFEASGIGIGLSVGGALGEAWRLTVRGGAARMRASVTAVSGPLPGTASDDRGVPYGGVGVEYSLSSHVRLAAGWDVSRAKFEHAEGTARARNVHAVLIGVVLSR